MSALTEPELNQLFESLSNYADDAIRQAIDDAHDPYRAGQFVRRLRKSISDKVSDSFIDVALCVALGEAKVETATPILAEALTQDAPTLFAAAARYALQRMGKAGFIATMAELEVVTDPAHRAAMYQVLFAAADADPNVRKMVAEFCAQRCPAEFAPASAPNPAAIDLARAMVFLGDARIQPFLEARLAAASSNSDKETLAGLLQALSQKWPPALEPVWKTPWIDQCRRWADEHRRRPRAQRQFAAPAGTAPKVSIPSTRFAPPPVTKAPPAVPFATESEVVAAQAPHLRRSPFAAAPVPVSEDGTPAPVAPGTHVVPDQPASFGLNTSTMANDPEMPAAPSNLPPPERLTPIRRAEPKVGRNDPCPCGSGKKYKKCCGR